MTEYQVLARKYRPQTFREVLGQDAIVATLKNGIKKRRMAHAYLFSGSRGTGKTTLARLFAKALNCQAPSNDCEPCNACSSCKEIAAGSSLDVLEVDGASNRGIDDIRQINETVGYSTASGRYKIYIIDEVHMLTKEAFNALLKTLEEPPEKVKFFFATTEPHKVLPTILSRCQRFNLNRIPQDSIIGKLKRMTEEQGFQADEDALRLVANRADGGLRDAESLLDQILSFHEGGIIDSQSAAKILGVMPQETFFRLDKAAQICNFAEAFEIAEEIFSEGKDLTHFVEMLSEHFRNILVVKLSGADTPLLSLSENAKKQYIESAQKYRKEQCLELIDYLVKTQQEIRFAPSPRIALEAALLHVIRTVHKIPIEVIVQRLAELENKALSIPQTASPPPVAQPAPKPKPKEAAQPKEKPKPMPAKLIDPEKQAQYDTLLQFAAVELEGTLQKSSQR
ncbi:DNA polymerase III subunit gamma/tau [Waddlia chondrophila 2032/99]|uniref:DNA polymerase III subunit gamma/tau n=2 Tax=Waddlia chondrophila TaxID=71667 RepID=D6YRS8_WADCW|nr:DNA polymerase III subunit gamma/tau [Waddlia chondrophila]ADI38773.1 DNA polymerase III, gamma and tau subunits [Waddlia chondrophila WSU 86-1044]CCB91108.1 DNA polymerase III subunit gamma/tau [Waddlia chondrophila 2032/99]